MCLTDGHEPTLRAVRVSYVDVWILSPTQFNQEIDAISLLSELADRGQRRGVGEGRERTLIKKKGMKGESQVRGSRGDIENVKEGREHRHEEKLHGRQRCSGC